MDTTNEEAEVVTVATGRANIVTSRAVVAAEGEIWLVDPRRMRSYLATPVVAGTFTPEEMAARTGPQDAPLSTAVAVLPLAGPVTQRPSLWTAMFGGTSTEMFGRAFRAVMASNQVGGVVIDVDSGGGTVCGVHELTDAILGARGLKPIVAVANSFMASAAYEIASVADEIVATPGSMLGSLGVIAIHVNEKQALANAGLEVETIFAGQHKAAYGSWDALSEAGRQETQRRVDYHYEQMVKRVAAGRGVSVEKVQSEAWGQGLLLTAERAVEVGMADRVGTLDSVIAEMGDRIQRRQRASQAAAERRAELSARAQQMGIGDG